MHATAGHKIVSYAKKLQPTNLTEQECSLTECMSCAHSKKDWAEGRVCHLLCMHDNTFMRSDIQSNIVDCRITNYELLR